MALHGDNQEEGTESGACGGVSAEFVSGTNSRRHITAMTGGSEDRSWKRWCTTTWRCPPREHIAQAP